MRVTRATSSTIVELKEGTPHQFVCCVCGLVHDFQFTITNRKEIYLRIWENDVETQREFKKVLRRLRKEGLPEVADRVKEMNRVR